MGLSKILKNGQGLTNIGSLYEKWSQELPVSYGALFIIHFV